MNKNMNDNNAKNISASKNIAAENNIAAVSNVDSLQVVAMIDRMMKNGVSRLKVDTSDELNFGEIKKSYHHGRCDVNSPWACGTSFDVLEE